VIENDLYVACINLTDRRALVVGAGPVGLEKVEGLLTCNAIVTVVAPDAHPKIQELASKGDLEWREREYDPADLDGCFLAIAATSDTELNTRIFKDAEARSMLINVVDVPHLCNFILPAILRRGPLAIAISTSGASPALAKRMKAEADRMFGPEYARLAELLDELRAWAKETLPTYEARRDFFEAIVNGSPDPIELLRQGNEFELMELLERTRKANESRDQDIGGA
jgi:precorrin-2 dehydrogenase / sirohydrochlorin ferrochelatase